MANESASIVQRVWNYCHVLRDDGVSYGDYVEQLTYLLCVIFRKAQNKIQDPAKLRRLIDLIDTEVWAGLPIDVKGDIYEGLLQKNAEDTKSGAGQYFTPRPLIHAIVEVMRPQPRQTVCDPAAGTGGFLLAVHDYVSDPARF